MKFSPIRNPELEQCSEKWIGSGPDASEEQIMFDLELPCTIYRPK